MFAYRPMLFIPVPPGSRVFRALLACLALCATPAFAQAQDNQALPAWEQLSDADREALVAPIRDRWNANPDQRARLMHHAKRWKGMTPEERRHVRHGMKRWAHLDPEKRDRARVLFGEMRKMTREQRRELRAHWKAMTPAERDAWIEAHRKVAERTR
jgi:hypothetical protein